MGFIINPYAYSAPAGSGPLLFLAHFDDANGSTATVDKSSYARAITWGGNAQVTTSSPAIGTGSLVLDGTGDYISIPGATAPELNMNSGDFTIEFWYTPLSLPTGGAPFDTLFSKGTDTSTGFWCFLYQPDGKIYWRNPGSELVTPTVHGFVVNTAYALAFQRVGTTYVIHKNGTVLVQTTNAFTITANTLDMFFGSLRASGTMHEANGKFDEIRITKGTALYGTSSYTPQTLPFPDP